MRLKPAEPRYDQRNMQERFALIEQSDEGAYHRNQDIEVTNLQRIIMTSPNGKRWALAVDNNGKIDTVQV
jgi:hypothetical protein